MPRELRLEAETLNTLDLKKIPAAIQTDLCFGAIELAIRHRADPGYQDRFEKWLAEQKKTA